MAVPKHIADLALEKSRCASPPMIHASSAARLDCQRRGIGVDLQRCAARRIAHSSCWVKLARLFMTAVAVTVQLAIAVVGVCAALHGAPFVGSICTAICLWHVAHIFVCLMPNSDTQNAPLNRRRFLTLPSPPDAFLARQI